MEKILERVKAIILNPRETWSTIKAEEASVAQIVQEYLIFLAAIPAVAGFFGWIFTGFNVFRAFFWAILYYIFTLIGVWLVGKVINFFAPNFNAVPNNLNAFKVAAYSYTPVLVAGIFILIPPISWLSILGLYGLYVLYLGLPLLMECPSEKVVPYTVAVIVGLIVIYILVRALAAIIIGGFGFWAPFPR